MRLRYEYIKWRGEQPAWYWGRAFTEISRDAEILYIMPLNWIVAWSRNLYFLIRQGPRVKKLETIRSVAWKEGWVAAKKQPNWDF